MQSFVRILEYRLLYRSLTRVSVTSGHPEQAQQWALADGAPEESGEFRLDECDHPGGRVVHRRPTDGQVEAGQPGGKH